MNKSQLIFAVFMCTITSILPNLVRAAVLEFDEVVAGETSYAYDADGDSINDAVFSTTDNRGFNTVGPGPNMSFIVEPGIEGTSLLNPDLRVDFQNGAIDTLRFGFALNDIENPEAWVSFEVYDSNDNLLGSDFQYGQYTQTTLGVSSFPEGVIEVGFPGAAAYALFDFNANGGRYIIDNFEGTFGSTEAWVRPIPPKVDSDGDGLWDEWEENGLRVLDKDGQFAFIDLPALGAKKDHKDIFVYVDWLEDSTSLIEHSHKPVGPVYGSYLDDVVDAFANASVANADGVDGISLHIIYGSAIEETQENKVLGRFIDSNNNEITDKDLLDVVGGAYDWESGGFDTIKNQNFPRKYRPVFHYALFGHSMPFGYSGISRNANSIEGGASDFLVAIGGLEVAFGAAVTFYTERTIYASTFMHELGHNLGLGHGGVLSEEDSAGNQTIVADNTNYKPNHLSVMNYSFQFKGLRTSPKFNPFFFNGNLDYHSFGDGEISDLDENNLDEPNGLSVNINSTLNKYGSVFWRTTSGTEESYSINGLSKPIDWNIDKDSDDMDVKANINKSKLQDNDGNALPDEKIFESLKVSLNEWDNLNFKGGAIGGFFEVKLPTTTPINILEELTTDEIVESGLAIAEPIAIKIDIKPGTENNAINLLNKGYIPVSIISTEQFDASDVDAATLELSGSSVRTNGTKAKVGGYEDVNSDGILDLIVHFAVENIVVDESDTELVLQGLDKNGFSLLGRDSVTFVPQK